MAFFNECSNTILLFLCEPIFLFLLIFFYVALFKFDYNSIL